MVAVDTSVWIAAFRDAESTEAERLRDLLDDGQVALPAPVRLEILTGASRRNRVSIRRSLSALPILFPSQTTWTTLDQWIEVAADAGVRFGFADLLIAAIAAEHHATIWSLDHDFARMAKLRLVEIP
jgi:predicted nucleic acid-binding protein